MVTALGVGTSALRVGDEDWYWDWVWDWDGRAWETVWLAAEDEYCAHREAATVHWVRRVPTEWGEACARSLPDCVVSAAVWICGLRFELRKAVRRFVSRREGVGAEGDILVIILWYTEVSVGQICI